MDHLGITGIRLRNFKGVGSQGAYIPIRPITLLFGANSAGKSTVLQSLHYLRDVLERRNANPDATITGGAKQDLGGYRSLVHNHDLTQSITVGVEIRPRDDDAYWDYLPINLLNDDQQHAAGMVELSHLYDIQLVGLEVTTAWNGQRGTATVVSFRVSINGEWVASLTRSDPDRPEHQGPDFKARWSPEKSVLRVLRGRYENHADEESDDYPVPDYEPQDDVPEDWSESCLPTWGRSVALPTNLQVDHEGFDIPALLGSVLGQLLEGIGRRVLAELQQIRYIGPWRTVPDRQPRVPRVPDESRWSDGLGAWDALAHAAEAGDPGKLIPAVNEWLESDHRLAMDYRLEARREITLDANGPIVQALQRFMVNYDDLSAADFASLVWQPLLAQTRRQRLTIVSKSTGLPLAPADIGVGISQVLPLIVAAHIGDRKTIAIEQPELHIHPAMQVALGDLAIDAAHSRGVNTLIETHSEHLVLRIMRRLRETFQGGNEDRPPVTPNDICILFVEADPEGTCIREMPLNELGQLVKAWPGGFFEEGFREQFGDA